MPLIKPPSQETLDAIAESLREMAEKIRTADPKKIGKWESNHNVTFRGYLDVPDPEVAVDEFTVRIEWLPETRILSATLAEVSLVDGRFELGLADVETEEADRGPR